MKIPKIIKTPIHVLTSTSTGYEAWAAEHATRVMDVSATDTEVSLYHLQRISEKLNAKPARSAVLSANENRHVDMVVRTILRRFVRNSGYVRNTDSNDVGVVIGASYSVNVAATSSNPDELACDVIFGRDDGREARVSIHVFVVFPHGFYTTWSHRKAELLPEKEGRILFCEQAWMGPSAEEMRAESKATPSEKPKKKKKEVTV